MPQQHQDEDGEPEPESPFGEPSQLPITLLSPFKGAAMEHRFLSPPRSRRRGAGDGVLRRRTVVVEPAAAAAAGGGGGDGRGGAIAHGFFREPGETDALLKKVHGQRNGQVRLLLPDLDPRSAVRKPSPTAYTVSLMLACGGQQCEEGALFSSGLAQPHSKRAEAAGGVRRRASTVVLFVLSIIFLFADQNLLAPNLTAVARDFGFSDAERDVKLGGSIPFAFFVVGGLVSVVVGPMADVMNRKVLYVLTVLVGTIPCLLTYWVRTYAQFFVLRTLTGVAVGGAFPLIYSLASDLTLPHQRAMASSVITIAMGVGATLGQAVAGFIGPSFGWRLPFVVIALPSVVMAALITLAVTEPPRTARAGDEEHEDGAHSLRCSRVCIGRFMSVFTIRTNLLAFCQSIPGCLPWGAISAFLTDFLHEQKGMSVEAATSLVFVFGMGCFLGNMAGGLVGQWAYNRHKPWAAYLMAITTGLGYLPFSWLINAPAKDVAGSYGAFTLTAAATAFSGGVVAAFTGPLVRALVMNANTSQTRGSVFSVFMVTDDLGKGLGPAIVASLIPAMGRRGAINLSLAAWLPCAAILGLMAFTVEEDERRVILAQQQAAEDHGRPGDRSAFL